MSRRDDLLHLSPEALTQIANAGLVKRALRELAADYRPRITVDEAGLLDAQFSDGVQTRWPPGVPIQQAQCSCGAAAVCRHRIIAALAYREDAAAAPAPTEAAGVGTTSDAALARVIPGRPGYWLDLGLVMFVTYLAGCAVGSWLRDWVLSRHRPAA